MKNRLFAFTTSFNHRNGRETRSHSQRIFRVALIVIALGILASCTSGNISRLKMAGNSMEPNIKDGQVVIAEPVDDIASLQRGDVILIHRDENALLKRLIALPGETIEMNQGTILINGEVYDEPYEVISATYVQEPLLLAEDEYYVLGDNREESIDSHSFGPITGEMILKRVTP